MLQTEFLDDYQLTTREFATAIRVSHERVKRVIAGHEPVDADLALRLARLFGGSAEGWLNWQNGFELWLAHERIAAQLEAIAPLDPDTRLSVLEDEPLDPELVDELRRRMVDLDDPRRWVVVSALGDEEGPLHEKCVGRMFYDVESDCYCTDLLGATPFKSQAIAESVAAALGRRKRVIEVTKQDLEALRRDRAADRELRERFFRSAGPGMSEYDAGVYLRDRTDMVAYLEAAAEEGDREIIAVAVADVMKATTARPSVEYLEAHGALGDGAACDVAYGKVSDVPCAEGDEI